MKVKTIGYGRSAIPCEFMDSQPCGETIYKEVYIEDWEDDAETFKILREQVNSELGIREDIESLQRQRKSLLEELKALDSLIRGARSQWLQIQEFQEKLGICSQDPIPF